MDIKVKGGQVLSGEIFPSGSKNSAVALLPCSILFDKEIVFENVPDIKDVNILVNMLKKMGSKIEWNKEKKEMSIDNSELSYEKMEKKEVSSMRGTSLLWGPMLARFGKVVFEDLPLGCTLGIRPLDPQYKALRDLGVEIEETLTSVRMDAGKAEAAEIWLDEMSPTATENAVMFATSLSGKTKIIGAASEPGVQDVCEFLIDCGAKISGVGSDVLEIEGGQLLSPVTHRIWPDHYEIATFLAMGAVTGGEIRVHNALPGKIVNIMRTFEKFGINIAYEGDTAVLEKGQIIDVDKNREGKTLVIKTRPWPDLPVDLIPVFIPLALAAKGGHVLFHNWMYEAGLFWTSELSKLGANIIMADPHRVIVMGGNRLYGGKIAAPYIIRAVVSMVMTTMIAEGESMILNADALYRGHPKFSENLKELGADIEEIS